MPLAKQQSSLPQASGSYVRAGRPKTRMILLSQPGPLAGRHIAVPIPAEKVKDYLTSKRALALVDEDEIILAYKRWAQAEHRVSWKMMQGEGTELHHPSICEALLHPHVALPGTAIPAKPPQPTSVVSSKKRQYTPPEPKDGDRVVYIDRQYRLELMGWTEWPADAQGRRARAVSKHEVRLEGIIMEHWNWSYDLMKRSFFDLFRPCGEILGIHAPRETQGIDDRRADAHTRESLHICFRDGKGADRALAMQNLAYEIQVDGRRVNIVISIRRCIYTYDGWRYTLASELPKLHQHRDAHKSSVKDALQYESETSIQTDPTLSSIQGHVGVKSFGELRAADMPDLYDSHVGGQSGVHGMRSTYHSALRWIQKNDHPADKQYDGIDVSKSSLDRTLPQAKAQDAGDDNEADMEIDLSDDEAEPVAEMEDVDLWDLCDGFDDYDEADADILAKYRSNVETNEDDEFEQRNRLPVKKVDKPYRPRNRLLSNTIDVPYHPRNRLLLNVIESPPVTTPPLIVCRPRNRLLVESVDSPPVGNAAGTVLEMDDYSESFWADDDADFSEMDEWKAEVANDSAVYAMLQEQSSASSDGQPKAKARRIG